jgi:hypothetical protein
LDLTIQAQLLRQEINLKDQELRYLEEENEKMAKIADLQTQKDTLHFYWSAEKEKEWSSRSNGTSAVKPELLTENRTTSSYVTLLYLCDGDFKIFFIPLCHEKFHHNDHDELFLFL